MSATTFVLLSFEGPDPYANAGGLSARITGLSSELAELGYTTHLFFVGDPRLPGDEVRQNGCLHLHRWCQWISTYHPHGVYDGEEGKVWDWSRSLPDWLVANVLEPEIGEGNAVVVLAEEWHTVQSLITLRRAVDSRGWQDRVSLLWNGNNPFGFDRIPWQELNSAAAITTVSRYMRTLLAQRGIEARVIPNGIGEEWLQPHDALTSEVMSELLAGRTSLTKVARWDPDKGWDQAVEAVSILKRIGMRPLLFARGGLESYGSEVLRHAQERGLDVRFASWERPAVGAMVDAMYHAMDSDVIVLNAPLNMEQQRALFHGSGAVLANSHREPFGLVGLEAMACGGVAMVGCSGEDYATAGHDSISLQTSDPWEIVHNVAALHDSPTKEMALRRSGRDSAARYTWNSVIRRCLFPALKLVGVVNLAPGQEPRPRRCPNTNGPQDRVLLSRESFPQQPARGLVLDEPLPLPAA